MGAYKDYSLDCASICEIAQVDHMLVSGIYNDLQTIEEAKVSNDLPDLAKRIALGEPFGFVEAKHLRIFEDSCLKFDLSASILLEIARHDIGRSRSMRELVETFRRWPNNFNRYALDEECGSINVKPDEILSIYTLLQQTGEYIERINPLVLAAYILLGGQYDLLRDVHNKFLIAMCKWNKLPENFCKDSAYKHLCKRSSPPRPESLGELLRAKLRNPDNSKIFHETAAAAGVGVWHVLHVHEWLTSFIENVQEDAEPYKSIVSVVAEYMAYGKKYMLVNGLYHQRFSEVCGKDGEYIANQEIAFAEYRLGLTFDFPGHFTFRQSEVQKEITEFAHSDEILNTESVQAPKRSARMR
jgi:hypothetical protein